MTKNSLYQHYIIEKLTSKELAVIYGYSSKQTILNALRKFGIPIRSNKEAQDITNNIDREVFIQLYTIDNLSISEIARRTGSSTLTIRKTITENNIPKNNPIDPKIGVPQTLQRKTAISNAVKFAYSKGGLKHWNTGNATSEDTRKKISKTLLNGRKPAPKTYGDDWIVQRTSCLQRDEYTCQHCLTTKNLEVHHWVPYRFSLSNDLDNLITLCNYCHIEKHKDYRREGFIKDLEYDYYD